MSTPAYGGKITALEPKNLTRLFLTHLHFDHTEGLSEFMLAPWIYYREGPLQVYGPPGTEHVVRHLTEAYTKDIDLQMFGLEQLNATGYVIKAKDVLPGEVYRDNNVRITAFPETIMALGTIRTVTASSPPNRMEPRTGRLS